MASKRRIRRRACEGKRRYPTRQAAKGSIYWFNRDVYRGHMEAYKCQFCAGFHIGHPAHVMHKGG